MDNISLLILLLQTYKPDIYFKFEIDDDDVIVECNNKTITIDNDTKWISLKKGIDKLLSFDEEYFICKICDEPLMKFKNNKGVMCNRCYETTCLKCMIEIFMENEGINRCPFCRYSTGDKITKPEAIIRGYIMQTGLEFI